MSNERLLRDRAINYLILGFLFSLLIWALLVLQAFHQFHTLVTFSAHSVEQRIKEQLEQHLFALDRFANRWKRLDPSNLSPLEEDIELYLKHLRGYRAIAYIDENNLVPLIVPEVEAEDLLQTVPAGRLHRLARERSRATGESVIVPPAESVSARGRGITHYSPIINGSQFKGFIAGIFVVRDLLNAIVPENLVRGFDLKLLYRDEVVYQRRTPGLLQEDVAQSVSLILPGQEQFEILITPSAALYSEAKGYYPEFILFLGFALSILFSRTTYLAGKSTLLTEEQRDTNQKLEVQVKEYRKTQDALIKKGEDLLRIARDEELAREEAEVARSEIQHYKMLVESSQDAIISISSEGIILTWNRAAMALFRIPTDEALGKNIVELLPFDSMPLLNDKIAEVLLGEKVDPFILLVRSGDYLLDTLVTISIFDEETGTNSGISVILSDITELERLQQLFKIIFEAAPYGIVIVKESGVIEMANPALCETFGYKAEELIGKEADILGSLESKAHFKEYAQQFFAEPETRYLGRDKVINGKKKSGKVIPLEVSLTPVIHHDEIFALASVLDVTERKAYEEELQFRRDEMEQLLYTVSHDLKSPLITIRGFVGTVQKLLEKEGVKGAAEHLERIERAARRMNDLIRDLLQLSRVGRKEEESTLVDVSEVISEAMNSHATALESKHIQLVMPASLPQVVTRGERLLQIFENLIGNAIKYGCPSNGMSITIEYREESSFHIFTVRDEGPGIPAEFSEKIFILFQRLPRDLDNSGTGLGLAIVKKITQSLGGKVWLESTEGNGAAFSFSIPDAPPGGFN